VSKGVMPQFLAPSAFILLRILFTATLALTWWFFSDFETIKRRHGLRFILCALTGVAINQLCFFEGLNLTTPAHAAVIFTVNPALTLAASWILEKEKIHKVQGIGLLFSMLGALGLAFFSKGNLTWDNMFLMGDLLIFINALSYAFYLPLVRPLLQHYKPISILSINFLLGSLLVLPFGITPLMEVNFENIPLLIWIKILYVLFAVTFITYLLSIYGLKRLTPFQVSIYVYVQPILASFLDIVCRGFKPDFVFVASSAAVLIGVWLAVNRKN